MKLRANRPLAGAYGSVREGDLFDTDEQTANKLMAKGLAEPYFERKAAKTYETKVITPNTKKRPE